MKTRPKRRVHPQVSCAALPKPRRSIPVAEVNDMLEREAARHRREPTLYDERTGVINTINEYLEEESSLFNRLRSVRLHLAENREELRRLNHQLSDELSLDPVR